MDVRRLAMLRELADRGSVGAVADEMQITPSAVSQQLKLLEREAGAPLVEPAGRGVQLTSAGRELASLATELAVAIERTEANWLEYMGRPAGDVKVAMFPTGAEMLFPGLINRLADEPAVNLICTDRDPTHHYDVLEMVTDHDVVVADSPTVTEQWHERGLNLVPLLREPFDVALPEDHRLADRRSLSPKDVIGETWIGAPLDFPYDRVLQLLAATTGEPMKILQRFDDNSVVEACVAAGLGIAILPRFTTRTHANGLVTRPLTGIRAHREISAVVRPDRMERHSVRFVVDVLREEADRVVAEHQGS